MSLSSLQYTTSDLKFELYAFCFTEASWALRRAAVGSSDRGIKAVTNGAEQTKHKYGSTACTRLYRVKPQDTFAAESSHHSGSSSLTFALQPNACCVFRILVHHLSCLENLPSSLKIRIMQTRQTHSHPPHAWPCCFPGASVCPAAPEVSSTMKDTPPVQRSKLTTCVFLSRVIFCSGGMCRWFRPQCFRPLHPC